VLKALRGYRIHEALSEYHKALGETMYMDIPLQPAFVFTIDPENVEYICKTHFENFPKGDLLHSRMVDLLGNGIFNVDGAAWHSQRKTSSRMFTANRFKNHIWKVVDKNSDKVVRMLQATPAGEAVDLFDLLNRFTLDSIGEIGFGADIGSLETADSPFLRSFDKAQQIILLRFVVPGWSLLRLLGLGSEWSTRKNFGMLRDYSKKIVQDLRANRDPTAADSFVGLFMKSGESHSDALLEDLVLNFLIAGRDTTAQAMAWCLWNVLQHPEVERRILEEAESVCSEGALAYEHMAKLDYLQAVISESLRLFPSVPIELKYTLADDTLPNGTFVPRGTTMAYSAYCMGRSAKLWGPDAEQFRPERWLAMQGPVDAYAYPVFHAGPRECLGKRLAMVEMKALLLRVLRTVKLSLAVSPEEIRPDLQVTLGMSTGLPCHVARR
jgi:cytochrome P450